MLQHPSSITYTTTTNIVKSIMSAVAGRAGSKVAEAATKAAGKAAESGGKEKGVLQRGAKRDPELYVSSLRAAFVNTS